jgi:uncharacterized protein (TIGR02217 family)
VQAHDGQAVTTPPSFPTLAGLGFSVHKKPVFSTIVVSHVSGREVRDALYQNPIWQFELTFDGLDSSGGSYPGLGAQSLQTLMGFFLLNQGQYGTFLYTDPTDHTVTGQGIGTGDGATTTFTFGRTMGGFFELVGWVTNIAIVYLNGVVQPGSAFDLAPPNQIIFTSAPGSGVAITADFSYAFQCRFDSDDQDFEQFMSNLWKADSVKFKSVRTS